MEAVEKIKALISDLAPHERAQFKEWVISQKACIFGADELAEAAADRGHECDRDHVDDLTNSDIREMAEDIGMVDGADSERLAEAIADMIYRQGDLSPTAQLWLAGIRGRDLT